ncbi:hypothetical protein HYT53_01120 [Candidatus Woesearchaeota archaeon]|nr:hypothetical protein [Candidatus Woesearchaeota archaeon]
MEEIKKIPRKVESINIIKTSNLTPEVRNEHKLKDNTFVELRVERDSPPETKIVELDVTPLKRMRNAFRDEGVLN